MGHASIKTISVSCNRGGRISPGRKNDPKTADQTKSRARAARRAAGPAGRGRGKNTDKNTRSRDTRDSTGRLDRRHVRDGTGYTPLTQLHAQTNLYVDGTTMRCTKTTDARSRQRPEDAGTARQYGTLEATTLARRLFRSTRAMRLPRGMPPALG